MEQSLEKATQESTLKQLADAKLRRDYADAVAVLDRIPKEVLDVYARGSHGERNGLLSKIYDDPKYNAAFDRCIDVMTKLMLKIWKTGFGTAPDGCSCFFAKTARYEANQFFC